MVKKLLRFIFTALAIAFAAECCCAAERVALMLEGADPKAAPSSYNALYFQGLEKARERFGKRIQTQVYNSYSDDAVIEPLLRSAASESDLVIITSVRYVTPLMKIKEEFPDCSYVVFDARAVSGATNIVFREEEGGFLAGALAALMTSVSGLERIDDGKTIGIILGEKVPPAERFLLGFRAGARYAAPEVKTLREYTGSFTDGARALAAAGRLRAHGADVIFCAAGPASLSVIRGAESGGWWCIGVDSELEIEYPDTVLASVVKRSGLVVSRTVEYFLNGELPKGVFSLGLAEGCIDISTWTREAKANIPVDVREYVDEVAEKLRDRLIIINGKSYGGISAD